MRSVEFGARSVRWLAAALALLLATEAGAQVVMLVNFRADRGPAGALRFEDLKDAIEAAAPIAATGTRVQVWAVDGTYYPGPVGAPRSSSFVLRNNVELLGGFRGEESTPEQRQPGRFTVLSGDLGRGTAGQDSGTPPFSNRSDNALHVVYAGPETNATAVMERFQIVKGSADGLGPDGQGGGVFIDGGSPVIRSVQISDCQAVFGGGVYIGHPGRPLITGPVLTIPQILVRGTRGGEQETTIGFCRALTNPRGGLGAALYNASRAGAEVRETTIVDNFTVNPFSDPLFNTGGAVANVGRLSLVRCFIARNTPRLPLGGEGPWGGAIDNRGAEAVLDAVGCFFGSNTGLGQGAAVLASINASATFTNCVFSGNISNTQAGGGTAGMWVVDGSLTLNNCTIYRNMQSNNSPELASGVNLRGEVACTINNTIIWACEVGTRFGVGPGTSGESAQITYEGAEPVLNFSTVQNLFSGLPGEGTNNTDPSFVDPDGPNNVIGTFDDDLRLSPGSLLVNTGMSSLLPADRYDLDGDGDVGEPVPLDFYSGQRLTGEVDRGAHETAVSTAAWIRRFGGDFTNPANWNTGIVPGDATAARFDDVSLAFPPNPYTVTLPDAVPIRNFSVVMDTPRSVTLRLRDQGYTMVGLDSEAGASIRIGTTPGRDTRLSVFNEGDTPAALEGRFASLGDAPGAIGRLTLSDPPNSAGGGFRSTMNLSSGLLVGRAGVGEFNLSVLPGNSAQANVTGRVSVGRVAGSSGTARLVGGPSETGSGAVLEYRGASAQAPGVLTVGDGGAGALSVESGARLRGVGPIGAVTIASGPLSSGQVMLTGAGSSWVTPASEFVVGDRGPAVLTVQGGATLTTTTSPSGGVSLARGVGSSATVSIVGAGSSWTETSAPVVLGEGGAASVNLSQGVLTAPQVTILPRGTVSGVGTVNSQGASGGIFNLGTISPGNPVGALVLQGNYRQIGVVPGLPPESGQLSVQVAGYGEGQFDRLLVAGQPELGGALIVSPLTGSSLPFQAGLDLTLVQGGGVQGLAGRFDVAYLPPVTNMPGAFFNVRYGGPEGSGTFVRLTIAQLTSTIDYNPVQAPPEQLGVPTAVASGDLNGDGLADLAITVTEGTTAPGSVFVLMNRGVDASGDWRGFAGAAQFPAGVQPSGVAIGDINGDGRADVAVTNIGTGVGAGTASFLRNETVPGTTVAALTPAGSLTVGRRPSALLLVNLDDPATNDRRIELVVANTDDDNAAVYRKNEEAGFAYVQSPAVVVGVGAGSRPEALATAIDSDNGKRSDLVIAGTGNDTLTIVRNTSAGGNLNLSPGAPIRVGRAPKSVKPAKLRGPAGRVSFVSSNIGDAGNAGSVSVVVDNAQPGQAPNYAPAVDLPAGTGPLSLAALDMDDDTDPDLAVLTGTGSAQAPVQVRILRNDYITVTAGCPTPPCTQVNEQLAFVNAQDLTAGVDPQLVVAANLTDPTGVRQDLVVINRTGTEGGGDPDPRSVQPLVRPSPPVMGCPTDINGDGNTDPDDLADYIACFFGMPPCGQADYNRDGTADPDDLADFIAAFFGPPC